jgi:hypothetical protein
MMTAEPWVKLESGKDLSAWAHSDEIAYNQNNRQSAKHKFFVDVFDFLKENNVEGDYLEFGCHRARTFRMALTEARKHNIEDMRFYAFDSFQGLPEPTSKPAIGRWHTGGALMTAEAEFNTLIEQHGLYPDKIRIRKGFYDKSLNEVGKQWIRNENARVALATIDCDLYESAQCVFPFIEEFLQEGSVIYLDDAFVGYKGNPSKGVAAAFEEHKAESKFKFERLADIGWMGRAYVAYD